MFERSYGPGAGNALRANLFGIKNDEIPRHKPFRQRSCREPASRTTKFFAISLSGNDLAGSRCQERRSSSPQAFPAMILPGVGVKNDEVLRHKPFRQRSCREPVSRTTTFFAKSLPGNKLAGSRHRERQSSLPKIKAFLATSLPEAGIENVKVLC